MRLGHVRHRGHGADVERLRVGAIHRIASAQQAPVELLDLPTHAKKRYIYDVRKTNDTYCIVFKGKSITERYYRDEAGWLKVSSRGRHFRASAEQVLNHLLPALAFGDELKLKVVVEHYDRPYFETLA